MTQEKYNKIILYIISAGMTILISVFTIFVTAFLNDFAQYKKDQRQDTIAIKRDISKLKTDVAVIKASIYGGDVVMIGKSKDFTFYKVRNNE